MRGSRARPARAAVRPPGGTGPGTGAASRTGRRDGEIDGGRGRSGRGWRAVRSRPGGMIAALMARAQVVRSRAEGTRVGDASADTGERGTARDLLDVRLLPTALACWLATIAAVRGGWLVGVAVAVVCAATGAAAWIGTVHRPGPRPVRPTSGAARGPGRRFSTPPDGRSRTAIRRGTGTAAAGGPPVWTGGAVGRELNGRAVGGGVAGGRVMAARVAGDRVGGVGRWLAVRSRGRPDRAGRVVGAAGRWCWWRRWGWPPGSRWRRRGASTGRGRIRCGSWGIRRGWRCW
ncbi:hypothetical protein CJ469_04650 [Nocardia farcinica]|nr:hypothetical protein CJ469_04650 [Nocardia farcinica]